VDAVAACASDVCPVLQPGVSERFWYRCREREPMDDLRRVAVLSSDASACARIEASRAIRAGGAMAARSIIADADRRKPRVCLFGVAVLGALGPQAARRIVPALVVHVRCRGACAEKLRLTVLRARGQIRVGAERVRPGDVAWLVLRRRRGKRHWTRVVRIPGRADLLGRLYSSVARSLPIAR